jgi:hypothetical protein
MMAGTKLQWKIDPGVYNSDLFYSARTNYSIMNSAIDVSKNIYDASLSYTGTNGCPTCKHDSDLDRI